LRVKIPSAVAGKFCYSLGRVRVEGENIRVPAETKFDPVWEQKYRGGHAERYPWDMVVSFVYRNAPRDRPQSSVRILELGCGTGSNLWFAAREGFSVAGMDSSAAAIAFARERFAREGLEGELVASDFTAPLPFPNDRFDLAIDRGSLTCTGQAAARRAIVEVQRVLAPGGRFLFNPYSQASTSFRSGRALGDGLIGEIRGGPLVGVGHICFYDEPMVRAAFGPGWTVESIAHMTQHSLAGGNSGDVHADWRVVAVKA
jgi:SAM-dependent methyltransferase